MSYLQYYRDENARHPTLCHTGIMFEQAREVIFAFAQEHGVKVRDVVRTSGSRRSVWKGNEHVIVLNCNHLNWLLVLHEYAHAWDGHIRAETIRPWTEEHDRIPSDQKMQWLKTHPFPYRGRWKAHAAPHAALVDKLAGLVVERGLLNAEVAARVTGDLNRIEARVQRAVAQAEPDTVRAKKIEKREAQIARLEAALRSCWRREKSLNTRISRARRSLQALQRAAAMKTEE